MTAIDILRRLAATSVPLAEHDGRDACDICGVPLPADDDRPLDALLATPDWHEEGCVWAEAVYWDAYHPADDGRAKRRRIRLAATREIINDLAFAVVITALLAGLAALVVGARSAAGACGLAAAAAFAAGWCTTPGTEEA